MHHAATNHIASHEEFEVSQQEVRRGGRVRIRGSREPESRLSRHYCIAHTHRACHQLEDSVAERSRHRRATVRNRQCVRAWLTSDCVRGLAATLHLAWWLMAECYLACFDAIIEF